MALGTILVLYDGSEAADSMLSLACCTVWRAGRIIPLYVTCVPQSLPLSPLPDWYDDDGQAALDRAEEVAWERGCTADSWLVRARSRAEAAVAVAGDCEADAIYLPAWTWRHPLRRLYGAIEARRVAQQARCPVLVGTWMVPADAGRTLHNTRSTASSSFAARTGTWGDWTGGTQYNRRRIPAQAGRQLSGPHAGVS
jgi:hypothetical protein